MVVGGTSRARNAVVRIKRGDTHGLMFMEFDAEGKVSDFFTLESALVSLTHELMNVTDDDEVVAVLAEIQDLVERELAVRRVE